MKYVNDIKQYFEDLDEVSSCSMIGRQCYSILMASSSCEIFYLLGTILIFLDLRIPGRIREQLVVAHYRSHGESQVTNLEEVVKLTRATGFLKNNPKGQPKNYPQDYFARLKLDEDLISAVINRLSSDDIYLQTRTFPDPVHRSTALANQAAMLYVILYFTPRTLEKQAQDA